MNGIKIQCGNESKNGNVTIQYPIAFSNKPAVTGHYEESSANYVYRNQLPNSVTNTSFSIYVNNSYLNWIAIGY